MFKMIGSDGVEYGPVPADTLKEWIRQGRANGDTNVREDGAAEWTPVASVPEFASYVPAFDSAPAAPTKQPVPTTEPAAAVSAAAPAGRGERLLAVLIDGVLGAVCALPGLYPDPGIGLFFIFIASAALLGVQVYLLTTTGQTIGKKLIGVRIVRFDDGMNPGFVQAVLLRLALPMLLSIVPFFSLIDVGMIFRGDRRCLHDLIAGTEVVKAQPSPAPASHDASTSIV